MRLLSAYFAARVALLALQVALRSDVMPPYHPGMDVMPPYHPGMDVTLPGLALIIHSHSRSLTKALPAAGFAYPLILPGLAHAHSLSLTKAWPVACRRHCVSIDPAGVGADHPSALPFIYGGVASWLEIGMRLIMPEVSAFARRRGLTIDGLCKCVSINWEANFFSAMRGCSTCSL